MGKQRFTRMLVKLKEGEETDYNKLYPLIYEELRELAHAHISREYENHTLSQTDLVHETYLKMIDPTQVDYTDKSHFLAISSKCMRQILVDYARKKKAKKRGGDNKNLTYIDEIFSHQSQKSQEIINISEALSNLEELNNRLSDVVEMKFFGNMTIKEIARVQGTSESTVKRDWRKARGWIYNELKGRFKVE